MSFLIDNEFKKIKRKYNLTTPKDLLDQAHVGLLEIPLDDNTGGFTVTNNRYKFSMGKPLSSIRYSA